MIRPLTLAKKTGFKNLAPSIPIEIRDERGVIFYRTDVLRKPVKFFNLPKGRYFIFCGSFRALDKPIKYKLANLPRHERIMGDPKKFKIIFAYNPNKCTVNWRKKTITFDDSFREKPRYVKCFVLYHEFGHRYYHTEALADLYARNLMMQRGFNPSQIGMAPIESLSNRQEKRKSIIVNSLI